MVSLLSPIHSKESESSFRDYPRTNGNFLGAPPPSFKPRSIRAHVIQTRQALKLHKGTLFRNEKFAKRMKEFAMAHGLVISIQLSTYFTAYNY
jgi:hypothetical protein